ncbi:MAG: FxsA family protein [Actinomycetota bacterium]|nr:FxsA family protein [Actinomycetota bacterium]
MPLLLFAAFVVVPLIELYAIIQVGQGIGVLPTVLILLAISLAGAWLVRREGARAWQALKNALRSGRLPSREVTDAALVLVGGTLLLTPGFLTDALGLFLVVPLTRPLARRALGWMIARRMATRDQRR